MAWFVLVLAGLLEVGWALGLKATHGFSRPLPTFFTLLAMFGSVYLLAIATRSLPIGTAYAVWVGIGSAGAVLGGIWLYSEPASTARLLFLMLLVISLLGLKMCSVHG